MSEFKKGDYIVLIVSDNRKDFTNNHCVKQRDDSSYLLTELDCDGSDTNGLSVISFRKHKGPEYSWRYATDLEAAEYERLGKPFDVTTLKPKFEVGKWYSFNKDTYIKYSHTKRVSDYDQIYYSEKIEEGEFRVKTDYIANSTYKEIMLDKGFVNLSEIQQYLPDGNVDKIKTELTINDLVEGEIYKLTRPMWDYEYIFINNANGYLRNEIGCFKFSNEKYEDKYLDSMYKKANFSERQWLNACIKADKFIPKDIEANKFIPKDEALNSDFVLPEKWCVVITKKNRNVLEEYRKTTKGYKTNNNTALCKDALNKWLISDTGYSDRMCWSSSIDNKYTEITFDQFKKYVLNSCNKLVPLPGFDN